MPGRFEDAGAAGVIVVVRGARREVHVLAERLRQLDGVGDVDVVEVGPDDWRVALIGR
jgi:hypothetical protein